MRLETGSNTNTHNTYEFEWLLDKQIGLCGGEGFCDGYNHELSGVEPQGESFSDTLQDEVRCRSERGEFEKAIQDFENISQDQYNMWVEAPMPIVHESGDKFYLSSEGGLYVYAGGVDPESRFYVCTLQRPD